jgi:hypothetical protein
MLSMTEPARTRRTGTVKARWRTTLEASKNESILTVDLYNQSRQPRRLEGFFVHMHLAWLYLFEAQYHSEIALATTFAWPMVGTARSTEDIGSIKVCTWRNLRD